MKVILRPSEYEHLSVNGVLHLNHISLIKGQTDYDVVVVPENTHIYGEPPVAWWLKRDRLPSYVKRIQIQSTGRYITRDELYKYSRCAMALNHDDSNYECMILDLGVPRYAY